jgi:hypothetical protein
MSTNALRMDERIGCGSPCYAILLKQSLRPSPIADAQFSPRVFRRTILTRVHQPRPTNGILVAMIVRNWTLVSSGRFAM